MHQIPLSSEELSILRWLATNPHQAVISRGPNTWTARDERLEPTVARRLLYHGCLKGAATTDGVRYTTTPYGRRIGLQVRETDLVA